MINIETATDKDGTYHRAHANFASFDAVGPWMRSKHKAMLALAESLPRSTVLGLLLAYDRPTSVVAQQDSADAPASP